MKYLALALAAAPLAAFAQLDRLRATIPGSLHQCEVSSAIRLADVDRPFDEC